MHKMCNLLIVKVWKIISLLEIVSLHNYRLESLILKSPKTNIHQEIIFSLWKFQNLNNLLILSVLQVHSQFLIYRLVQLQLLKNKKPNKVKIKKIFQAQLIKIFHAKLVDSNQNHLEKLTMRQKRTKKN